MHATTAQQSQRNGLQTPLQATQSNKNVMRLGAFLPHNSLLRGVEVWQEVPIWKSGNDTASETETASAAAFLVATLGTIRDVRFNPTIRLRF